MYINWIKIEFLLNYYWILPGGCQWWPQLLDVRSRVCVRVCALVRADTEV